tara:strand:+ start:1486 stop:1707 length:222 start_codon:yes stop_codon:yes gene_type:complete
MLRNLHNSERIVEKMRSLHSPYFFIKNIEEEEKEMESRRKSSTIKMGWGCIGQRKRMIYLSLVSSRTVFLNDR